MTSLQSMLQQTCYVYEVPGLELEWTAVSAPTTLSLVALTQVALGLTRRHRATGGAFGTARAGLGCFRRRSKMRRAVGELSRETGARPGRCPQWWQGQSGPAGSRIAMLLGQ